MPVQTLSSLSLSANIIDMSFSRLFWVRKFSKRRFLTSMEAPKRAPNRIAQISPERHKNVCSTIENPHHLREKKTTCFSAPNGPPNRGFLGCFKNQLMTPKFTHFYLLDSTGLAWTGLDCLGLEWTGLNWPGLDLSGFDWIGLDWTGLD